MKKILALFVAALLLTSLAVPVVVAEEAETYETLYNNYLAELNTIADEDIDLTTVLFAYMGENDTEVEVLTAAAFGFSEAYVLEEIADITSSYRIFALHLPTNTREGVADAMATLDLHPHVKAVGGNHVEYPATGDMPVISDEVKTRLYNWAVETWGWDSEGEPDKFTPEDLTGDTQAQDYRIYRLYEGVLTAIGYERVGDRVLTYSTLDQGMVVAKLENGAIAEIYELKAAYDAGIIDDAALDKIPANHGIWVTKCGDLNGNGIVEVGDILKLKAWIMEEFCLSVSGMPSNLLYDMDASGYVDVADIIALKATIMAA